MNANIHPRLINLIDTDIERVERQLASLKSERAEAEAIRVTDETFLLTPAHKLAEKLHNRKCSWSHIDGCSWEYQDATKASTWREALRERYLNEATTLLGMNLTDEQINTLLETVI